MKSYLHIPTSQVYHGDKIIEYKLQICDAGLRTLCENLNKHTNWFIDDARPAVPSWLHIIKLFGTLLTYCRLFLIINLSPGEWVDAGELGEGPNIFPIHVLFVVLENVLFPFLVILRHEKNHQMLITLNPRRTKRQKKVWYRKLNYRCKWWIHTNVHPQKLNS